jgi:hypothetical protein
MWRRKKKSIYMHTYAGPNNDVDSQASALLNANAPEMLNGD